MACDQAVRIPGELSYDAEMQSLAWRVQEAIWDAARRLGHVNVTIGEGLILDLLERGVIEPGPGLKP